MNFNTSITKYTDGLGDYYVAPISGIFIDGPQVGQDTKIECKFDTEEQAQLVLTNGYFKVSPMVTGGDDYDPGLFFVPYATAPISQSLLPFLGISANSKRYPGISNSNFRLSSFVDGVTRTIVPVSFDNILNQPIEQELQWFKYRINYSNGTGMWQYNFVLVPTIFEVEEFVRDYIEVEFLDEYWDDVHYRGHDWELVDEPPVDILNYFIASVTDTITRKQEILIHLQKGIK